MRTFATVAALTALAIAPAVAQDNMKSSPKPPDTPAAQAPAKPDTTMKSDAGTSGAASSKAKSSTSAAKSDLSTTAQSNPSTSGAAAGKPKIVSQQNPDEWLASSFKGTDVIGPDQKKIGDVSDVLFDKDGTIKAYVVGVGGFLGIGSKDVALAPSSFEVVSGNKSGEKKLKLAMTAAELKQAQAFKPYKTSAPSGQTTGMSKAPGGMAPGAK
jgi:sporulation protein YlmC with PRC-barrel domain